MRCANGPYGGYQAIRRDAQNQTYIGASESRKDGQAQTIETGYRGARATASTPAFCKHGSAV